MLLQKLRKGEYIYEYKSRDGRTVKFRGPRKEDVDDLLKFVNSLVKDNEMVLINRTQTRKEEVKYLRDIIRENRENFDVHLIAEVDGHAVANASVARKRYKSRHVGTLGISVLKNFRNMGIGQKMMLLLVKFSKELGLRLIILEAFAENKHAIHVYQKTGFRIVGRLPKDILHKGRYVDSVLMAKELH